MDIEREKELQSQIEQLRSELEGWYEWAADTYHYVKGAGPDEFDYLCEKLEEDLKPYSWTVHNNE